jgi:hypothetical protein
LEHLPTVNPNRLESHGITWTDMPDVTDADLDRLADALAQAVMSWWRAHAEDDLLDVAA